MPSRKSPQRHIIHAGYSIPAGAVELDIPEGVLRRAVEKGQVEYVDFAGLRRIPPREIDRLRGLLGKPDQCVVK
jgi:hypothetical protein